MKQPTCLFVIALSLTISSCNYTGNKSNKFIGSWEKVTGEDRPITISKSGDNFILLWPNYDQRDSSYKGEEKYSASYNKELDKLEVSMPTSKVDIIIDANSNHLLLFGKEWQKIEPNPNDNIIIGKWESKDGYEHVRISKDGSSFMLEVNWGADEIRTGSFKLIKNTLIGKTANQWYPNNFITDERILSDNKQTLTQKAEGGNQTDAFQLFKVDKFSNENTNNNSEVNVSKYDPIKIIQGRNIKFNTVTRTDYIVQSRFYSYTNNVLEELLYIAYPMSDVWELYYSSAPNRNWIQLNNIAPMPEFGLFVLDINNCFVQFPNGGQKVTLKKGNDNTYLICTYLGGKRNGSVQYFFPFSHP